MLQINKSKILYKIIFAIWNEKTKTTDLWLIKYIKNTNIFVIEYHEKLHIFYLFYYK